MLYKESGSYRVYHFNDFEEYLSRASAPEHKINKQGVSGWGKPVFDRMLHNARHGWSNSLDDISKWSNMVVEDVRTHLPKREIEFDRVGSMWDLDRVLSGDPECWMREELVPEIDRGGRGNIVRFVINTASSAAVRENSHTHRCGAILALTQLFEMCDFRVQFEVTTALSVKGNKLEFRTVSKRAGEALNMAAVSFWASKEMEQHIDFAICEALPECCDSYDGQVVTHYGRPYRTSDRGDLCFDSMALVNEDRVNWNDEESVRRYIVEQLKKQGVRLT